MVAINMLGNDLGLSIYMPLQNIINPIHVIDVSMTRGAHLGHWQWHIFGIVQICSNMYVIIPIHFIMKLSNFIFDAICWMITLYNLVQRREKERKNGCVITYKIGILLPFFWKYYCTVRWSLIIQDCTFNSFTSSYICPKRGARDRVVGWVLFCDW